jgi:multimeric flavodoxin WrbA
MKILLIQSSGRTSGNTAKVLLLLEKHLNTEAGNHGIEIHTEILHIAKADIRFCTGCRLCFDKGEDACPCNDGLSAVLEKMRKADAIVLASPVYVDDVSGMCKNLIDRLAFICHRPEMAGKTALLLATTGSTPSGHTFRTMEVALMTWGYKIAGKACYITGAKMNSDEIERLHSKKITDSTIKFLKELRKKRWEKPSFVQLLIFRVQQKSWSMTDRNTRDYDHWNRHSWLDIKKCTYFFRHKANPIKTSIARAIGALIALFMV